MNECAANFSGAVHVSRVCINEYQNSSLIIIVYHCDLNHEEFKIVKLTIRN